MDWVVYPLEENVVYGEGYRVPERLKTETRGAYMLFNPDTVWMKKREAEEMAEEKRFSSGELAAEYWHLKYMAENARLLAQEWETEMAQHKGRYAQAYKYDLEKLTYWLDVVHGHELQLDTLARFM